MAASNPHASPINLANAQSQIKDHWQPSCLFTVDNSHSFKIATISGKFIWHAHPDTDEVFYCISGGPLMMDIATDSATKHEDQGFETITVNVGDVFKVPRAYRHRPWTERETGIMMVEKVGTVNTGDEEESEEGRKRTAEVKEG